VKAPHLEAYAAAIPLRLLIMLHLCFFGFTSCERAATLAVTFDFTGGLSYRGASPIFLVVLVCKRWKISFSANTIGCSRVEEFVRISGRFSEDDNVLLPELLTGDVSKWAISSLGHGILWHNVRSYIPSE
jgi:hypothetical protein